MMTRPLAVLALLLGSAAWLGCPTGAGTGAGECASAADCGEEGAKPCAGCPPLAASLCVEGACLEREADEVDVNADVNLHRDVAASVRSFVHVLVGTASAAGPLDCASVLSGGRVVEGANVLAAGYKAVEGGGFHEGVNLGRAPAGELLVVIVATSENAGEGDVLATGCVDGLTAAAPSLDAGLIQVAP